jgi:hypothetical protein
MKVERIDRIRNDRDFAKNGKSIIGKKPILLIQQEVSAYEFFEAPSFSLHKCVDPFVILNSLFGC